MIPWKIFPQFMLQFLRGLSPSFASIIERTLHRKWSFPLQISVNVTKSAGNCGFGNIYWRNSYGKLHFVCSGIMNERSFFSLIASDGFLMVSGVIGFNWLAQFRIMLGLEFEEDLQSISYSKSLSYISTRNFEEDFSNINYMLKFSIPNYIVYLHSFIWFSQT